MSKKGKILSVLFVSLFVILVFNYNSNKKSYEQRLAFYEEHCSTADYVIVENMLSGSEVAIPTNMLNNSRYASLKKLKKEPSGENIIYKLHYISEEKEKLVVCIYQTYFNTGLECVEYDGMFMTKIGDLISTYSKYDTVSITDKSKGTEINVKPQYAFYLFNYSQDDLVKKELSSNKLLYEVRYMKGGNVVQTIDVYDEYIDDGRDIYELSSRTIDRIKGLFSKA